MDFCCFYFPLFCIHWLMGNPLLAGCPKMTLNPRSVKGLTNRDIFIFYLKSKVRILSGTPKKYVLYFSDIAIPADIQNLMTFLSYSPFTHNKC